MVRKATKEDIDAVAALFDELHVAEANGLCTTGWIQDVYPIRKTAEDAVERDDLYVLEADGKILGTAILNQLQMDVYKNGDWKYPADESEVLVMHTLVISPSHWGEGYAKEFFAFYEELARKMGCRVVRIDTNSRNSKARSIYNKMGYREAGIFPCNLFGIDGVMLLLMEKPL